MDAKNRVTVPAKWLAQEDEEFQVAPDPNSRFLMVMPPGEFARVESRIMEADRLSLAERRSAVRQFYSSAQAVATDKQGRVLLPENHCQQVGLAGELIMVGTKDRFEIWSKARWEETTRRDVPVYQRVAEEIGL